MKIDDVYRVKIVGFDHYGRGITRINNRVVFISNALKDEEVDIKITKINKKYCEGVVLEVIKESKNRIKPICPYFYECGGCALMHIDYNQQLLFKENKVREIISKFTTIDTKKIKNIVGCNNYLYYRNKVKFHVDNDIGFYSVNSNQLVKIDKCYIADDKINNILTTLKRFKDLKKVDEITIRSSKHVNNIMVLLDLNNNINENELISLLKSDVDSVIVKKDFIYKKIYGIDNIIERINGLDFLISPQSFFQVNSNQTEVLYNKVLEYSKLTGNESVLDLYCGTGTIGLFLSKYCSRVLGVEINKEAIKDANKNKEINNISNIEFMVGDTKNIIKKITTIPDLIIVDPPRSGLDNSVICDILKIKASKIVYVSCDPITLARDLSSLDELYDVIEITPVDMFPNTYHVECVVLLEKKV